MRRKDNKIITLALAPVIATLLIACGSNPTNSAALDAEVATEQSTEQTTEQSTEQTTEPVTEQSTETEATENNKEDGRGEYFDKGSLTEEEAKAIRKELNEWASDLSTYGFLYSSYDDVRACNYNQVFYNGAGIETEITAEMNVAITKYYEENGEMGEGDTTIIKKADMDKFLMDKAGITSDEINEDKRFGIYLDSVKASFARHGDTNYGVLGFRCMEVGKEGDRILAKFVNDNYRFVTIAEFEKTEKGYRIIKNKYIVGEEELEKCI